MELLESKGDFPLLSTWHEVMLCWRKLKVCNNPSGRDRKFTYFFHGCWWGATATLPSAANHGDQQRGLGKVELVPLFRSDRSLWTYAAPDRQSPSASSTTCCCKMVGRRQRVLYVCADTIRLFPSAMVKWLKIVWREKAGRFAGFCHSALSIAGNWRGASKVISGRPLHVDHRTGRFSPRFWIRADERAVRSCRYGACPPASSRARS